VIKYGSQKIYDRFDEMQKNNSDLFLFIYNG